MIIVVTVTISFFIMFKNTISYLITSFWYFQIFSDMAETFECYIWLQLVISVSSFCSAVCQIVNLKFLALHKVSQVFIISFAILNSAFSLIIFGLSDHYSVLHISVLTLSLCIKTLQCLVLGLILLKKQNLICFSWHSIVHLTFVITFGAYFYLCVKYIH